MTEEQAQEGTTEPQETPAPEQVQEASQETTDAPESAEADNPGREAAKWRTRLRETEAERDTLREQLEAAHRQMVSDRVAERFADPEDFFMRGGQVVLDDDGRLDLEAIDTKAGEILASAAHLSRPRKPQPNPAQGASASGKSPEHTGPSWSDALRSR